MITERHNGNTLSPPTPIAIKSRALTPVPAGIAAAVIALAAWYLNVVVSWQQAAIPCRCGRWRIPVSRSVRLHDLLIRGLDENAKELWRAGVAAEGLIFPVAAVRLGEEVIATFMVTRSSRQRVAAAVFLVLFYLSF